MKVDNEKIKHFRQKKEHICIKAWHYETIRCVQGTGSSVWYMAEVGGMV